MYSKCRVLALIAVMLAGMLLQCVTASCQADTRSVLIVAGAAGVMLLALLCLYRYNRVLYCNLTDRRQFVLVGMLILVFLVYMGLTGISVVESWPFIMLLVWSCACLVFAHPWLSPLPVMLLSGMMVTTLQAYTYADKVADLGVRDDGQHVSLPFGIQLDAFHTISDANGIRQYQSDLTLKMPDGAEKVCTVTVNHPARIGSWHIYQAAYHDGPTPCSVLMLVYDPLYMLKAVMLWLLMAVTLWWMGRTWRKHRKEDVR